MPKVIMIEYSFPGRFKLYFPPFLQRYCDKTPKGEQRMGNVKGNVFERLDDGFTKSTFIDKFGPDLNPKEEIQKLEPYVARFV